MDGGGQNMGLPPAAQKMGATSTAFKNRWGVPRPDEAERKLTLRLG